MNETANVREVLDICRDHVARWKMIVAMVIVTRLKNVTTCDGARTLAATGGIVT